MNKKNIIISSVVGFVSSGITFLGIVSCCGFPLLAAFWAWLGIGTSQLSFFAEYRPLFMGIAIIALAYGFYIVYKKKTNAGKDACCNEETKQESTTANCCTPRSGRANRWAKIILWLGLVAVISTFFFNNNQSEIIENNKSCCPATETVQEEESKPTCCPSANRKN